jgi:hypothetical protein
MKTPMTNFESQADNRQSWAPPRVGLEVERRDRWEVVSHGTFAGLSAGFILGLAEIVASDALRGDPWLPFDFAVAIVVGPEALAPEFPVVASVALGIVIHVLLSVLFGVVFVSALALTFQLSARPWLIVFYGVIFALTVWEVNFLAVLPVIAPELRGRIDLATQLWNGIVSYCLVYGPVLAAYVIWVRPGTLDRWWLTDGGDAEPMPRGQH